MLLNKLWKAFLWVVVMMLSFRVMDQMPPWVAGILVIIGILWLLQEKGGSNAA